MGHRRTVDLGIEFSSWQYIFVFFWYKAARVAVFVIRTYGVLRRAFVLNDCNYNGRRMPRVWNCVSGMAANLWNLLPLESPSA
jgi:hypothetical protein